MASQFSSPGASSLRRPVVFRGPTGFRSIGRSILLTLPMALWSLLMFTPAFQKAGRDEHIGALLVIVFMTGLFFLMMRTGETYRWRRIFFVALGFLFPFGFIAALIAERGTMSIPISRMVSGDTPFCFMVTPSLILPAAFARTIIFPGSILPTASNPHSIAVMIGVWFAMTLVLGKAWCSYACFFGGIEEGFAAFGKRRRLHRSIAKFSHILRLIPWAILVFVVLVSAAIFEPVYCMWLCPFKAVTEFPAVRNVETAIQMGVFVALFLGLVVVLPIPDEEADAVRVLLPVWRVSIALKQDQSLRNPIRPDKVRGLHTLPDELPDGGAFKRVDRRGKDAAELHEVRRLR